MRIAHLTDIHWTTDVPLSRLPGKRILGTANQYIKGRRHHFPRSIQQSLVAHVLDQQPDAVVITGDLTAQALPEEFEIAKLDLMPILESLPTVIMPGNHDVYTQGSEKSDRFGSYFKEWAHLEGAIGHWRHAHVDVFTLNPNRPTWINASGKVPQDQLDALERGLNGAELENQFVVLALHYPLLDRHGAVYDGNHHGLLNAQALIDLLRRVRFKPSLILHGHEHHGYRVPLDLNGHTATIVDCGSSGYAFMPEKKRAAAMAIYDVRPDGFDIERFLYDGTAFSPEPGGPFETGR